MLIFTVGWIYVHTPPASLLLLLNLVKDEGNDQGDKDEGDCGHWNGDGSSKIHICVFGVVVFGIAVVASSHPLHWNGDENVLWLASARIFFGVHYLQSEV